MSRLTFKYRLYPNRQQREKLQATLEARTEPSVANNGIVKLLLTVKPLPSCRGVRHTVLEHTQKQKKQRQEAHGPTGFFEDRSICSHRSSVQIDGYWRRSGPKTRRHDSAAESRVALQQVGHGRRARTGL